MRCKQGIHRARIGWGLGLLALLGWGLTGRAEPFPSRFEPHSPDSLPPIAQASAAAAEAVPAEVQGWFDQAKAAYGRGAYAEALQLQEKVLAWVKAHLRSRHPFRGKVLNNLGIFLSNLGRRAEALPPTEEAVGIYRELAQTNPAFRPDLARSLTNLGIRYSELGRRAEALPPAKRRWGSTASWRRPTPPSAPIWPAASPTWASATATWAAAPRPCPPPKRR